MQQFIILLCKPLYYIITLSINNVKVDNGGYFFCKKIVLNAIQILVNKFIKTNVYRQPQPRTDISG